MYMYMYIYFTCMHTCHVNVLVQLLFLFFTEPFALVIGVPLDMHSLDYSPEIPLSACLLVWLNYQLVIRLLDTMEECWASPGLS